MQSPPPGLPLPMLFFGTFCCDCAPSCWGHHQMNCMYVQMGTRVRMSGITCFAPSCGSYGGDGSFFRPCFVYCDCVDCLSHSHSHLASCCFICYHLDNKVGTQLLNKIKQASKARGDLPKCSSATERPSFDPASSAMTVLTTNLTLTRI